MTPVRTISDAERRARLVVRHHLTADAADATQVVDDLVALHATDPATPHLAVAVRVAGASGPGVSAVRDPRLGERDLADALYERRVLWRLHAMRRTLFVVPTAAADVFHGGVASDVAVRERQHLEERVAVGRTPRAAARLLASAEAATQDALATGEWRTQQLTAQVPQLRTSIPIGSGRWTSQATLGSRLLLVLAAEGAVVRGRPAGTWRSSQYTWARTDVWFDRPDAIVDTERSAARLVSRYLARFGPATFDDLRWWTGWTVARTRRALEAVDAVTVRLDDGGEGYVLADDVDGPGPGDVPTSVALLPALDPTPMGWTSRDWYLGVHRDELFDRNGNVGPSVWIDGRIVGGWSQRPDGSVVIRLLEPVTAEIAARVEEQAARLSAWLDGTVVTPRFRTPLERELRDGE